MFKDLSFLARPDTYLPIAFAIILLVKVVVFIKYKTRSWKLSHFIYFNYNHITSSRSAQTQTVKKVQNVLSEVVFTVAILAVVAVIVHRLWGS